jgi:hypothetical protein
MKKLLLLFAVLLLSKVSFGQINPNDVITLSGEIKSDMTLSSHKAYLLKGFVYVKNNATLTIQPGTIIMGEKSSHAALIITRTGKIMAVGTAERPIIFTSDQAVGERQGGDWAGIVLLGASPSNGGENMVYEGDILNNPNDPNDSKFGGSDLHHSSGKMSYVRIEFAGYPVKPDQEVNGLTMGGVGDGTQIDHIQVSFSNDDSYEWFGGTVNCKYLVAYAGLDDDWDTDNGFSGTVQFGFSMRNNKIWDANSGSNGFESDNDGSGSTNAPITHAIFSNMTLVGPSVIQTGSKWLQAAQLRRNTSLNVINSVLLGWNRSILLDGGATYMNQIQPGNLKLEHVIAVPLSGGKIIDTIGAGSKPFDATHAFDANGWFTNLTNKSLADAGSLMLGDPFNTANPNPMPQAGSPVLGYASFTDYSSNTFLDKSVTYSGAFNTNDTWMQGWTNFNPNGTEYQVITGIDDNVNMPIQDVNIYPNPTAGNCNIEFFLTAGGHASVKIYDLTGKEISTVADQNFGFGKHTLNANTSTLPKGIYLVKIATDNGSLTEKLSVVY